MGTSVRRVIATTRISKAKPAVTKSHPNDRSRYDSTARVAADATVDSIKAGMTGARFAIIACPMSRNVGALNDAMERLRPSHVPHITPATSIARASVTNCAIFRITCLPPSSRLDTKRGARQLLNQRRDFFRAARRSGERVECLEARERVQQVGCLIDRGASPRPPELSHDFSHVSHAERVARPQRLAEFRIERRHAPQPAKHQPVGSPEFPK